jgi:hypothetical protein
VERVSRPVGYGPCGPQIVMKTRRAVARALCLPRRDSSRRLGWVFDPAMPPFVAASSHNGAVRRLTGQGLKYSDLLGIAPTNGTRIGGFVLESIARFVDAVLDGAPLLADVEDGLATTRVLAAIERSVTSGHPVHL